MYNIGITFQSRHKSSFKQGSIEMVPLLTFTMTSIFTGEYFRTFTVIVIITCSLIQEPVLRTIEMFIHQIHFQTLHFRPQIFKLLSFRIRPRTSDNLDIGISFTDSFNKWFEMFRIFRSPLFVTNTNELQVERCRVSHICTKFSPLCCHITIGKFNQIKSILHIAIQIANSHMCLCIRILELARQTTTQHRKRLCSYFLRKLEEFKESQSVALEIIGIETMRESIFPTVLIQRAVLYRTYRLLPVIACS